MKKKTICFVTTFFGTAEKFLYNPIMELSKEFEITIIADFEEADYERLKAMPVKYQKVSIPRKIDFLGDYRSIKELYKIFKKEKYWAIHSLSHKPGLLVPIAAKLAGCKTRVYTFTGQYWAMKTGIKRAILKYSDWVTARINNHILVDGNSQKEFLIKEHVIKKNQADVLGFGSISGIDTGKFSPSDEKRERMRSLMGIPSDSVVYMYMGRLCKDKGVSELIMAYDRLCSKYNDVFMVFVGWDEDNYLTEIKSYKNIREGVNFLFYGSTTEPELVYQAADVSCTPSYREGFGMCVIEASALGIPVICSDVYGILDSYVDGETGLKCRVMDVDSLEQCMIKLHNDPSLRKKLGENGRARTKTLFSSKVVASAWMQYYKNLVSYE